MSDGAIVLLVMGALSPCCGYGTRKTSKRWARCKKCGGRVELRSDEKVTEILTKWPKRQAVPA